MTKEEFKACVYEAFHTNEHLEQFLECVGELYLQASPRWISVEDELPEACVAVLTTTQNGTQRVGCYEDGWWLANSPDLVRMVSITHWMPLPAPKKGD